MSPLVYSVLLHTAHHRPDCRLADTGTPDIRMTYFFSRAAYRVVGAVQRLLSL